MSTTTVLDVGALVLRVGVGAVMAAHGWNHIRGGGGIEGTARWFEDMGMRPGRLHAWAASLTELGAGALLVLGLLTPLAAGGVIGVMTVAWVTAHLRNGFFVFRPGQGYEYVMTLTLAGVTLAATGAGRLSADGALGIFLPVGWTWFTVGVTAGLLGAAVLLASCWRPAR
ncbi:DoxX family protein [Streptomyces sp. NPDC055140]